MGSPTPVGSSERIESIDVIRGIALLAIGFTIQYSRLQAADPSRATGIYVRPPLMTPEFMQHQLAVMKSFEESTNQAFGHGTFVQMVRENMKVFEFGYPDPLTYGRMP